MPAERIETDSHILVTIACLSDNYAFLLRDKATGDVALIDVPEAAPIAAELSSIGWTLSQIWLTHHHPDHIQGLSGLLADFPAPVYGAAADAHRLPDLDTALADGDHFSLGETPVHVIDVSGHTNGHIAFYAPAASAAFTADSLMALGCGRLFEGTPAQMHASLSKMAQWPDDTLICSGHEYTASNAKFALTVDPDNAALQQRARDTTQARSQNKFTVPSLMGLERATNPFLRAGDPALRAAIGMTGSTGPEVFTKVRALKDSF
ncbi:hydroxyacylglutathione hydrolase [Sulfitobacter guttiformis]|uniref:Hydroxyacylglutathione hydrolase n=1 Tax=Sulfitobacter guttiformis TaxID=74349 RepID=A0A420DQB1_9RHOB|nr:hydroxyacylglutathione hydrolase [Sulfitobacter guttiformis]KIN73724.1 Hydroxyacylglutathione hydrolase [Sulfitobacter guttiformis KCTC 32187]RKE96360.1 hydroxyacylglutathione hydrolase [Sulfitobacter guttiformis]